jgi:putative heme-binding domain-containing protein
MKRATALFVLAAGLAISPLTHAAEDPFSLNIRDTPPLAPAQEQKAFHLPPGFQIQLVASEPDIGKPTNLAFDSKGRLWVSMTHEYPFPAKPGEPLKDAIKILEDTDNDGRADKITTFVDQLNIPIGLLPLHDGHAVIAYDCGEVCLYTDTNNDGKADKREVLYTGFGFHDDTHGMVSNFRRSFDGWVHGCHGFHNHSEVKDKSGDDVFLYSGNTYRFRLDGSKFEAWSIGQINPFGLCFDPLGNMYDSDSHSKPIYQILRGGHYEAFDRDTDDGLGLAPMMMHHLHGSTALAGSQFYADDKFPKEFRGNVFTGNVVTCRINRDRLEYNGSSPKAIEMPDFLSTDDPWFRPNQTVLGPDGAIYVADFYNRIIGHYEVPLNDPRRDFNRGRIWKITYIGKDGKPPVKFDISTLDVNQLAEKLNDPNLTARMAVITELSDRIGKDAIAPMTALLQSGKATPEQKIGALWVLYRLNALPAGLLQQVAGDSESSIRVHAMRALGETSPWTAALHELAIKGLADSDALVRRCAADALGQHPDHANVRPLLDLLEHADQQDTHLIYVTRRALLSQLEPAGAYDKLKDQKLSEADEKAIADVSVAVPNSAAAGFILNHLPLISGNRAVLTKSLSHAVRYAQDPNVEPLAALAKRAYADDLDFQMTLLQSIGQGFDQRGKPIPDAAIKWAEAVVSRAMESASLEPSSVSGDEDAASGPWGYEERRCADGTRSMLLSSFPGGETATGVLKSKPFALPSKLSFYLAGHNGYPQTKSLDKNIVRLRAVGSDQVLATALPPRNDTAQQVDWDLHDHTGQQAYIEVTDGDTGPAYAWLALGRFDPPVVKMPKVPTVASQVRLRQAGDLAGSMKLVALAPDLIKEMLDRFNDTETRAGMANSLALIGADSAVSAMKQIIDSPRESMRLRDRVAQALGTLGSPAAQQALIDSFHVAPARLQTALAGALSSHMASGEALLNAVQAGKAPARVLLEPGLRDRLAAAKVSDLDNRVKKLTLGITPMKDELAKLIAERRAAYRTSHHNPANGARVFQKDCMVCHSIEGHGGHVGPNLAGLDKRGIDRLVEDVLDPTANVDPAFRYSNIILKDGRIITGLERSDDGQVITFVDNTGKRVPVNKKEIHRRIESVTSLMPSNFSEIIKPDEFNDLMAYLLTK